MLNVRKFLYDEVTSVRHSVEDRNRKSTGQHTTHGRRLQRVPSNACYETAFTTAEPMTRIVSQSSATVPRRSHSSDRILEKDSNTDLIAQGFCREQNNENSYMYHSLDRLRSRSGGYVNVAAFGSVDCLDRSNGGDLWTSNAADVHSRSISSLSCHRTATTGLSPLSFSDASLATASHNRDDYENLRHLSPEDSPLSLSGQLRIYRNSPSKRLIGRRKGLEFYYGAKACKPGNPLI